ncbi:unnamed protein product [Periconia digitata]|uniref:ribonuclease H n=1 Tax=Periconia digitata TaxID=1303443 RepID=A0A9W4U8H7_9PLEO|nr:unnamed protein product [Periconia digitata]
MRAIWLSTRLVCSRAHASSLHHPRLLACANCLPYALQVPPLRPCSRHFPFTRAFQSTTARRNTSDHPYNEQDIEEEFEDTMPGSRSVSTTSSGTKRKAGTPAYYAVRAGFETGLFFNWEDAKKQTNGYSNPVFKKFSTLSEAEAFLAADANSGPMSTALTPKSGKQPIKYYGVQVGHTPGVYKDYPSVLEQVKGFRGGKQKSFATFEEAQAYVDEGKQSTSSDVGGDNVSHKGPFGSSTPSVAAPGKTAKKQKRNDGSALAMPVDGDYIPDAELNARKRMPTGDFEGFIDVYTDGAAKGNGQVGAVGGIGIWFGPNDSRNISAPLVGDRQTNQRAELTAIKRALEIVPIDRYVRVYSDSNYAIRCVTEWYKRWVTNNWKSSKGKDVENKDLIKPIRAMMDDRDRCGSKTELIWVKGHDTNVGNIGADKLASDAARKAQTMKAEGVDVEGQSGSDDEYAGAFGHEDWIQPEVMSEHALRDAEEAMNEDELRAYYD